ncbi:hypothetical protein [Methylocystis sp.]|uniref:hypothetical protein n=1 Tax=Methylocystis sp. TaxID=1911079 RepID=UPI003DA4A56C
MKKVVAVVAALLASSCAHQAQVSSTPAYDTVTSYSKKIPGRWLLYTDSANLNTVARSETMDCSAHTFPVDFANGFQGSVSGTLQNILEQSQVTDNPTLGSGARGIVAVRGESIEARLNVVPGFWTARIVANVNMSASVAVDGKDGRLFGKTLEGHGRREADLGFMCSGGEIAVRAAAETAQKNLLRKIGEEVANSERVRSTH